MKKRKDLKAINVRLKSNIPLHFVKNATRKLNIIGRDDETLEVDSSNLVSVIKNNVCISKY